MPNDDDDPPIRLILAALFHAAGIVADRGDKTIPGRELDRERRIREAISDADELLRQAGPP